MSRSVKKGPYVHPKLIKKVEAVQRSGVQTVIRTWSPGLNDNAGNGGVNHWSPRRPPPCPGVYHREHGWAQAGRVLSHPNIPWSRGADGALHQAEVTQCLQFGL